VCWISDASIPAIAARELEAKGLLQAEGFDFVTVELDLLPQEESDEMLATLGQMTGARTVPRIFSSGESLGGCDDLVALQRSGQLAGKLPAGTTDEASLAQTLAAVQGARQALQPAHAAEDAAKDEAEAKAAARAAARQRFREELAAAAAKE